MVTSVPLTAGTQTLPSKNSKFVVSKSAPAVADPAVAVRSTVIASNEGKSNVNSNTTGLPSTAIASSIISVGAGVLSTIVVTTSSAMGSIVIA